jgi:hypothetical protein
MIIFSRSALIAPDKSTEAMAFVRQMAAHLHDNFGKALEVTVPIGGNPNRIAWHVRYESLAEWESLVAKLMADGDYMKTLASGSSLFVTRETRDEIWRVL